MIPLLVAGAVSALGTGIQAYQNSQANKLAQQSYDRQRTLALQGKYEDVVEMNKPLLSIMNRKLDKAEEAIENQAASGGATVENVLAAKQANNEAMADTIGNLAQGNVARRDAYNQQLLNIDMQRTAQQMAAKQASGQAWGQLAGNLSSGVLDYGAADKELKMLETLLSR